MARIGEWLTALIWRMAKTGCFPAVPARPAAGRRARRCYHHWR
ncbi:MAG TPA: hypothetical protein VGQ83_34655 [Polyangia bacterium]